MATRLSPSSIIGMWTRVALCCAVALASANCGDVDSDDVVYVSVFNGYPGDNAVTVYGPDGKIASSIGFGERSELVPVKREQFQEFLVTMDSLPTQTSLSADLFTLYPKEIVTIFISRRSASNAVQARMQRHHQVSGGGLQGFSAGAPCVLEFFNGLSMDGTNATGREVIMQQWNFTLDQMAFIYDLNNENIVQTECGPLNLNDPKSPPVGRALLAQRRALFDTYDQDPWIYLVEPIEPEDGAFTWRWAKSVSMETTSLLGFRSSREWLECMAGAISIEQEEDPNAMMTMTETDQCARDAATGEPAIPTLTSNPNAYAIAIDQTAAAECMRATEFTGKQIDAGSDATMVLGYHHGAFSDCARQIRLRNPGTDTTFDGQPRTGPLVQINTQPIDYTWNYITLYGRPVSPLVEQVTADALYQTIDPDGPDFKYPGGVEDPQGPRTPVPQGQ